MMVYSGEAEAKMHGVGVVMDRRAVRAWEAAGRECLQVNSRLMKVRFKTQTGYMTVVVVYAPTNKAEATEEADEFYVGLGELIQGIPKNDVMMIMGDFNARVANDSGSDTIGKFCLDKKTNSNGERLIDLCAMNGCMIMNTWFRKKRIHQGTWQHPRTKKWHMIDLVVVNRKYCRSVEDVSVRRGASIESDHKMVMIKMRLHLKGDRKKKEVRARRIDREKLGDGELLKEARQRIKDGGEEGKHELELEEDWARFKKMMQDVSGIFFEDKKEKSKRIYMSQKTRTILEEKRDAEISLVENSSEEQKKRVRRLKQKLRKRLIRDREKWWKTKAIEIEKNMKRVNMGRVFEILNLKKKKRMKMDVIRDKDGTVLKEEEKQLNRWKTYFEELFNVESKVEERDDEKALDREDEKQDEIPTRKEVEEAVESLKSFKAAGPDGIVAELLKAGGEPVVEWVHRIIQKIWKRERVVEEWKTCTIVPLFKKGDAEVCDNYRGISLLSIPSKILAKVLYRRIEVVVEPQLHEAQCGFRKGRGCIDQVFNLKECMSMSRQKEKPLYMCFIDLRKAYDSVNRELLWKAMREYGISGKIVRIMNSLYENTRAQVRVNGVLSEHLSLKTGVKQGCVLSPLLFNIFIDWVVRRVMKNVGDTGIAIKYSQKRKELHVKERDRTEQTVVNMLMYADDMVVMDSECENVRKFLIELDAQLSRVGMTMNVKKTKMMVLNGKIEEPIVIRGEKVEEEKSFPYLGVSMRQEHSSGEEVALRIAKAVKVFRALHYPLWKRKQVSVETKVAIYRAAVLPVLLYGSEVWVLSVKERARLEVFQMKCLRVILDYQERALEE